MVGVNGMTCEGRVVSGKQPKKGIHIPGNSTISGVVIVMTGVIETSPKLRLVLNW
jgi:hypothetical protein